MNTPFPKRIMHVEDDALVQKIARIALTQGSKHTLLSCSSGKDAIFKAAAFGPDLILMDYYMPDMDGPDVLKILQRTKALQTVPVIFITGREDRQTFRNLGNAAIIGSIEKPFNPAQLSQKIESLWKEHFTD
ncbi:MAG: response regulator [Rhodospirillales bacterium]|nr:response regulator [Alphaproteobacteria bacterium]USO04430.1 MAG: response regulator [Rhodospirillales bacterium]